MRPDQPRAEQQPDPRITKLRQHASGEGGDERGPDDILDETSADVVLVHDAAEELEEAARSLRNNWEFVRHEAATGDDSDRKYAAVLTALDQLRAAAEKSGIVAEALQRIVERAKLD